MFRAAPIVLDAETRAVLEARVRAAKTPQRAAVRARIILLAADGVPSRQISRQTRPHQPARSRPPRGGASDRLCKRVI